MGNIRQLLDNIDLIHTTELGKKRILRNISIGHDDVVEWCKSQIKRPNAVISKEGKNWYVQLEDFYLTIHAKCYTIITAHKGKRIKHIIY